MPAYFLILAVTVTMCLGMPGISFAGDQLNPVDMKIIVDAKDPVTVKAYNASYTYNTYVSMRDMAKALSGTAKRFAMTFDEESETMVIGNRRSIYACWRRKMSREMDKWETFLFRWPR